MVTKEQLLVLLPVRNQVVLTEERQNTADIRELLLAKHREYAPDYDLISHYFDAGDIVETSRGIFEFLKYNVPYKKELGRYQTIKSPALILTSNEGSTGMDRVDCKNYASFIAGTLDSLHRKQSNPDWDWCYRFASYQIGDPEPGHVFVVVTVNDQELWIDPVYSYFNEGDLPEWELDEKPAIGALYSISGVGDTGQITVNGEVAWTKFLLMIQLDAFGIKTLMLKYPYILYQQIKPWCRINNYDFDQLVNFLTA